MSARLTYYPDCGAQEEAEHNAEVVRLKAWQEGTSLPAMTAWDWKAWDRTDVDLELDV